MENIKPTTVTFTVTVKVGCSEPESFESQKEFDNNDGKAMTPYLKEKIVDALAGSWQHDAKVEAVS